MQSRHTTSAVLVALVVAVGCAPSNPGIDIEGIALPTTDCGFAPGVVFLAGAALDTSEDSLLIRSSIRYTAALQLTNRMINNGNNRYPLMANTNDWQATEAEVELRGIDGAPLGDLGLPARFRVPASGLVPAAGTSEPSRAVVFAEVIPPVYGEALLNRVGTIEVAVRITGTTSGDSTQQTGEWVFPLELCVNCLFECDLDPATCEPLESTSCLRGQDRVSQGCYPPIIPACTPTT